MLQVFIRFDHVQHSWLVLVVMHDSASLDRYVWESDICIVMHDSPVVDWGEERNTESPAYLAGELVSSHPLTSWTCFQNPLACDFCCLCVTLLMQHSAESVSAYWIRETPEVFFSGVFFSDSLHSFSYCHNEARIPVHTCPLIMSLNR